MNAGINQQELEKDIMETKKEIEMLKEQIE